MASASEFDLDMERSQHWKDVRTEMHRAIEDGDETRVKKCLDTAPALRLWFDPDYNVSARCKAVEVKAFRIHGLLVSRDCALKDSEKSSCYVDLPSIDRAEIRRQQYYTTECEDCYIDYLKSKSRSHTCCDDFKTRLNKMFQELCSDELNKTVLKVVSTAPYLDIRFDYKSENVQGITGCRNTSTRGLSVSEEQRIFIGGSAKEDEVRGTFTHEMCHLALYLVYRNNGKPYFRDDTKREQEYKVILNDIKRRENYMHLLIQQAFMENEEEELIVRVPHILAQYGSDHGNVLLEREIPGLRNFFKNVVIQDMQTYIENIIPPIDSVTIKEENARLRKAFKTGKLNVVFETPLKRGAWENGLLHIFTGPELRLLEIMVHDAVQSTGQPYLFFEVHQWDSTLTDVLLDYICAFVLVTVHPNEDVQNILKLLSEVSCVTGTKVILLVEDSGKEDLIRQVEKEAFFADKCKVHEDVKATFENVTQSYKGEVFTNSRIKLQGQDATEFPEAMNIETFLRYIDTNTFLDLCELENPYESGNLDLGPPLHELDKCVKNYYVERVCRRAVEINLKHCRLDDENEAFGLLGCPHDSVTKLLPRGYEAKHKDNLTEFEKFVLLQQPRDYEDLLKDCHYSNKVVHLLQFSETHNGLLWSKSNGPLSHLPMMGNDDYTVKRLLNVNEKVVVVSGAPGMGKSVLASRLCTDIKNEGRERWVLHVDLPQRLASVKTPSLSLGYLGKLCQVQKDGLEFALFEESLNRGKPFDVVVIFDAFDEINEKCRKDVLDLVSFLIKTKVYKIYMFTRTVFKTDLQDALHTVSYKLVPFSDENQEEFLTKYREQRKHSTTRNDAVSQQFQKLYTSLKATNSRILDSPLLLRMMAEIESRETAASDYSSLLQITNISADRSIYIVHIYKMFVEYKYLVHRKEKRKENITLSTVRGENEAAKLLYYESHGLLAMRCIFGQYILKALLNEDELNQVKPDGRLIKDVADNRLQEGFVSGLNDGIPEFVHKTFAEFFAAHYLLQKAKGRKNSRVSNEVVRLYGEKLYEGVMLFLDGLASASFPLHSAVMNNDASYFEQHVIQREDMFNVDELQRTPLHVAVLRADRRTLKKLPMDDELIKQDMLNISPFGYVEILFPWDTHFKLMVSWWPEDSAARHRLNALWSRFSLEALSHFNEIMCKRKTFKRNRCFLKQVIFTAVRDDLQGVLDVYLTYFYPKKKRETLDKDTLDQLEARTKRSSRCSAKLQIIGDLDRLKDVKERTVPFYAKSKAVCKMLLPYCDMRILDRYGNTMLHISAEEGNLETTQFHLAHSSVDATNKLGDVTNRKGETPLHLSAHGGHKGVVKLFLSLCRSVDVLDDCRRTPMDRCVILRSHLKVVRLLLLRTRIYDARHFTWTTTLHLASAVGGLNTVMFLLPHTTAHTCDYERETCLDAALRYFDVVKCLIPHSLVNSPDTIGSSPVYVWSKGGKRKALHSLWPYLRHSDPRNALMISRDMVDVDVNNDFQEEIWCVKLLFLHLDVIAADRYSRKLLYDTIEKKLCSIGNVNYIIYAKLFLPHSNLCEDDYLWRTALKRAEGMGVQHSTIRFHRRRSMMNNTDDPDIDDGDTKVGDEDDNRMLLISAKEGDVEGVEFYLSHSSVYITDENKDTPLHLSARNGHTDVVKLLIPFYTSVDMPNVDGDTPMHMCARNGHLDVAKLLFLRSPMSCLHGGSNTPLHVASKRGALDIVTFLLPHSLVYVRDFVEQTCLHPSVVKGKLNVLRCLIPHSLVNCPDVFGTMANSAELFWSERLVTLLPYSRDYELTNLRVPWNFVSLYGGRTTLCLKLMTLFSNVNAVRCYREALRCYQSSERLTRRWRTQVLNDIKLLHPLSNVSAEDDEWKKVLQKGWKRRQGRDLRCCLLI